MPKSQFAVHIKRIVRQRAKGCCEYCLSPERFATHDFSIEHIIPTSKQGSDSLDNLALSCQGCNNAKYNKTEATDPVTEVKCSLFPPRNQSWEEHFSWDESYAQMGQAVDFRLRPDLPGDACIPSHQFYSCAACF